MGARVSFHDLHLMALSKNGDVHMLLLNFNGNDTFQIIPLQSFVNLSTNILKCKVLIAPFSSCSMFFPSYCCYSVISYFVTASRTTKDPSLYCF
jgi:hypothetical protein